MIAYILRRLLFVIPIALGVSIVCFALVYIAPGDPLNTLLPEDASAETIAMVKKAYGFDKPIPVQYFIWLGKVLTGDFGNSIASGRAVTDDLFKALGNTILLAGGAVVVAFSLAFVMGLVAGYHSGGPVDRAVTGIAVIGVSIPNYWLGIVLVIIFAVELNVLPATGMGPRGSDTFNFWEWDHFRHLLMPMLTLSMIPIGIITRTTRAAVAEVLNQDFVETLRAKGLGEREILVHVIKNALPQVLAVMGLQFGYLMGGSILVETIFTWPGTGFLLNKAILTRDLPVLQGTILVLAMIFVATNLVIDLLQTMVDPRLKRS
ncbi:MULTISPECIES: ABC transporter permease [Thalassobaculum]|uniref:Peptide/nickel transport system permease protein n=1 Tax=Thalassobaculum litoreum DSM 18839 TaxID=1123362 RepID=A0A8G2EW47_9PROT|nr:MULTISPECIES: ABC transporter permease [Thalassobaculum]SDF63156.1 peptide/nickel transport system permease protein [Thalassobaculum litoreum DSM 18839]